MRNPRARHRRPPYFKVQVLNPTSMSWQDDRFAFDTAQEAQAYIEMKRAGCEARVVIVEKNGRQVVTPARFEPTRVSPARLEG